MQKLLLTAAALAVFSSACTWSTESNEILARHVSDWEGTRSASEPWAGEPIRVHSESGNVRILAEPGRTKIELSARFYAGASSDADAEAAFRDIESQLDIELTDAGFQIVCLSAAERHGSAVRSTTGCDLLTVRIPAGAESHAHQLSASASFGGIIASGVVGSVNLHAPFGLRAEVTPLQGSEIILAAKQLALGNCPSILLLPSDFAADKISLVVEGRGDIHAPAFPDLAVPMPDGQDTPKSAALSRGTPGSGASRIDVHSSLGDVILDSGMLAADYPFSACKHLEIGSSSIDLDL
jgi:hypothetical protein